jgi:TonB-dependent SusC/RagA subfamily outer membrane receptor
MKTFIFTIFVIGIALNASSQTLNTTPDSTKYINNSSFIFRPSGKIPINSPLYFLDNKEITHEELLQINPTDIASIKVLKDSLSTALYGTRGKYGVILVEGKKDKHSKTNN